MSPHKETSLLCRIAKLYFQQSYKKKTQFFYSLRSSISADFSDKRNVFHIIKFRISYENFFNKIVGG